MQPEDESWVGVWPEFAQAIHAVVDSYATLGAATAASQGMTSDRFALLVTDARLIDLRLTRDEVEAIFTAHCPTGGPKVLPSDDAIRKALFACSPVTERFVVV